MAFPDYVVWFRGKPACPCLAEWLPVFEAELIRRGVIRESIDIYQLIGGAEASGGTHTKGGAFDIVQRDDTTIWVARQMGADATWARLTMDPPHAHGVLTGCPHNGPAAYQIDEVRAGGDGLLGTAPDPGPRPLSGRTWRQGIEWARQQEDIVASLKDLRTVVREELARHFKAERERDAADRARFKEVLAGLDRLSEKVSDDATQQQVKSLRQLINDRLAEPEPQEEA